MQHKCNLFKKKHRLIGAFFLLLFLDLITQIILYSLLQFHLANVKFDLNKTKVRRCFWPQILIEEKRSKALVKKGSSEARRNHPSELMFYKLNN